VKVAPLSITTSLLAQAHKLTGVIRRWAQEDGTHITLHGQMEGITAEGETTTEGIDGEDDQEGHSTKEVEEEVLLTTIIIR